MASKEKPVEKIQVQELVFTTELITPAQAGNWLKYNNPNNRPISKHVAERYCRDMNRGAFPTTHAPIAFDWNGNIGNGQHRLTAIVMSGKPQRMVVCRGENPANFPYFDRTKPRNAGDTLALMGIPNQNVTAAAVRVLSCLLRGVLDSERRMEPDECLAFYLEHQEHLAPFCSVKQPKIPAAALGTLAFLHFKYPKESVIFYGSLHTGAELRQTDSILHLREWLHNAPTKGRDMQGKQITNTLSAFKHFLSKTPIKQLKAAVDPFAFLDMRTFPLPLKK